MNIGLLVSSLIHAFLPFCCLLGLCKGNNPKDLLIKLCSNCFNLFSGHVWGRVGGVLEKKVREQVLASPAGSCSGKMFFPPGPRFFAF